MELIPSVQLQKNPQVNSILEIIHQVIANSVRTFKFKNNYLDKDYPWSAILATTAFPVRSMYHTTNHVRPDGPYT